MELKFVDTSNSVYPINGENIALVNELPTGVFSLHYDEKSGISLIKEHDIVLPDKIFGLVKERADIILNTYRSRKDKTTGVLLSGLKGTGKTLLANYICKESKLPIIKLNTLQSISIVIPFLKSLINPYVLFIDEFEKKIVVDKSARGDFNDRINYDYISTLLTFLDGDDFNQKLVLLTINNVYKMPQELLERPSRIFYHYNYGGLADSEIDEVISDYINNNYKNSDKDTKLIEIKKEISFASDFGLMTFDMLYALLEETCRYPKDTISGILNRLNVGLAENNISCKIYLSVNGILYDTKLYRSIDMKDFELQIYSVSLKINNADYEARITVNDHDFLYKEKNKLYFKFSESSKFWKTDNGKKSLENSINPENIFVVIEPILSAGLRRM